MAGSAELMQLMNSFQRAVAVAPLDAGWRDHLSERLGVLRQALAEHIGVTEGPDGLYHELVNQAPRLEPGVRDLVRDHESLLAAVEGLYARVTGPEPRLPAPDDEQIRGWARQLVDELNQHRQRGADLVYEAYDTDLGGET